MLKRRPFQEFLDTAFDLLAINAAFQEARAQANTPTQESSHSGYFMFGDYAAFWGEHPAGHISLIDDLTVPVSFRSVALSVVHSSAEGCEDHLRAHIEPDFNRGQITGLTLHGNSQYPFYWLVLIRK